MSSDSPSFRLERNFESAYDSFLSFQSRADIPFGIAITRESGLCYPFSFRVSEDFEESYFMAKKILLSLESDYKTKQKIYKMIDKTQNISEYKSAVINLPIPEAFKQRMNETLGFSQ